MTLATSSNSSMFDLSQSDGTTPSERFLARLCKRSFLSLWSFPNTFTSEGIHAGSSSGKEFIDVLVVFGNHVILFSDKEVAFDTAVDLKIAWPRWFKRAVERSVRQLYGARSWLLRFPNEIYLDAACKRPLPVPIPAMSDLRVHLVATTRGTAKACEQAFPGSRGSLMIDTGIAGATHKSTPFTVGIVDPTRPFVHILDELSLEAVLRELDTAQDLITYLEKREKFLSGSTILRAPGEEQLLASYLMNGGDDGNSFLSVQSDEPPDLIVFDESFFDRLRSSDQYKRKKAADQISYLWDGLIESFIQIGDPKHGGVLTQPPSDTERALRILASTSRFERRFLSESFADHLSASRGAPGKRRVRTLSTRQNPERAYVFLAYPKREDQTYDEYRTERHRFLQLYCQCVPLRFPQATTIVGLGVDHPGKSYSGGSEDLVVYTAGEITEGDRDELRRLADELGVLSDGIRLKHQHSNEYPSGPKKSDATSRREEARKAKRKMRSQSRRKNR